MNHPIFAPAFGESSEHIIDLVAQLVEHFTFNERVPGSSPGQVTLLHLKLFKKSVII